ncbi:hypothetical protein F0562_032129 [Nyssa sinensis]|uniref:ubiquitinyl hydrolase 1 n=1 Tax=Nyssa sinensis TaxID=561372 RepID=A0A5J5AXW1_9ASTE|nr:hypothetical protein F0562_032129 [Nyssa sinensis]
MLFHYNQTSDILYFEVLDIRLPELRGLKTLKVAFHHATKDEVVIHTIRLPRQSTVGDVINDLKTKVELSNPNAELRLLEVFYHKIYKIFPLNEKIENINDQYWTLRAEEIPEEEKNVSPNECLIHVYHFMKDTAQNQVQVQNFGEPFFLVIHEGETLAEVKVRVQKKLRVPDEEFSKWKFAFLSLGRPVYLQDSDIVSSYFQRRDVYGAWEQYLGLEHSDKAPKRSYAANQVVRFRSLEKPKDEESKLNNYDDVVERVARHLGLDDPSKIRLTSHNCYSQQPKPQPIKYRAAEHLSDMLVHYNQTSDILYFEVLDIPLPELRGLKTLKVAFHHATKDEVVIHTIKLPRQSTVGDVINDLKTKVELSNPNAELRLLEVFYHKIYKIFPLNEKIENINDQYWTLRAEEIPEEEKNVSPNDRLIHVYHFMKDTAQNQVQVQNFGEPFFLVIHEGETLAEVEVRVQKKLRVPDEEFSKWKFAFLSLGRPEYLQDSDIVSSYFQRRDVYGAWEQYLGLEHSDSAPKRSYAANQVFRFRSLEKPKDEEFCLELSKLHNYDDVVERVACHLGLDDPCKIRLTSHNCYSQQPKPQPIKYRGAEHLNDFVLTAEFFSPLDRLRIFYILNFEVLDIPLPELRGLKTLKVAFHHATKDEVVVHTIRLPRQSTVGDVINELKTKVELSNPNAELRLLEVFYHKIYKIFPLNEKIENINDQYWTLRAEEIPEEEKNVSPNDRLIHVYHFMKDTAQNQVQVQNFGEPFFLVIHEGETLAEVKVRVQKKLRVPDEEFSKWKFAFLSLGRPEYLQDSDIVSSRFQRRDVYGAWEQYLGLEHSDNAPKRSYAANQNDTHLRSRLESTIRKKNRLNLHQCIG